MTKELTRGYPAKVIALFTLPLLLGNAFQQLYGFADAYVVGQTLGVEAFAAIGATTSLSFLIIGFAWGTSTGMAIPTAQAFGAKDYAALRRSVAAGAFATLLVSAALIVVAIPYARPLLVLMRTPDDIIDASVVFLTITYLGVPATMGFNFLSNTIRALGDSITPLYFLAGSLVLNIGLVFLFIKGFGMGVGGAAGATILAQVVAILGCLWLVIRKFPLLHLSRSDWRINRKDLMVPLRIGLPMGFQASIIAIGNVIVQFSLNGLGTDAIAAYSGAQRVELLAMAPLGSFGLAMATYTAQNFGARQYRRIRQGVAHACAMACTFALTMGALNIFFGHHIVGLLLGDANTEIISKAHTYLAISGACYIPLALLFVLRNSIQGMGKTLVPTIAGVMELLTRSAVAATLAGTLGFLGICFANPAAWVGAAIPLIFAYARERRRLIAEEEAWAEQATSALAPQELPAPDAAASPLPEPTADPQLEPARLD